MARRRRYKKVQLPISEDLIFFIVVCITFMVIFTVSRFGESSQSQAKVMKGDIEIIMDTEQLKEWLMNNPVPGDAPACVSIYFMKDSTYIQVPVESIKWDKKTNQLIIGGMTDSVHVDYEK